MNRKQRRAEKKKPLPASLPPVHVTFAEALRLHQAGHLADAEKLYRQVLLAVPRHANSLHLLGVLAFQVGRHDSAVDLIGKAIALKDNEPAYHSNLGAALRDQGKFDEAVASYDRALALKADFADAHSNRGNALRGQGKFDEAVASYDRALAIKPDFAEAHYNRGIALQDQGKLAEAVASYDRALTIKPGYAEVHNDRGIALQDQGNLDEAVASYDQAIAIKSHFTKAHSNRGNALRDQGKLDEAVVSYDRALAIEPDYPKAHNNRGATLRDQGKLDEAAASYDRAIAVKPDYAEAHSNRGNVLRDQGKLDEAVASYDRAIAIKPDFAEVHNNRGIALQDQGKHDEALTSYGRALAIKPRYAEAHGNLLMGLHYSSAVSSRDILAKAKLFSRYCESAFPTSTFPDSVDLMRRLRVGYVSADFGNHPVGYFLSGILDAHDREAVEVFCYSNRVTEDDMTQRLHRLADHWRNIVGIHDRDAALAIRRDKIDILVDLSGHTAKNRLLLFAERPAPVQVTWLGYFGTTGLSSIDYILADRHVIPEGEEDCFVERVLRLPDSYLCFTPPTLDCPISEPPSSRGNSVTFGSFNNHAKTSVVTVALWSKVLTAVANSKLLLKSKALNDGAVRKRLLDQFAANGIAGERVFLEGNSPRRELFSAYNRIDVALDPTPYGGGTTTAEALWMGVPVVTLRGKTWVGRVSESILSTVGLPDLVASSTDEYVKIAARLAANPRRLTELRSCLRPQLEASAFCNSYRFTRHLEKAYRSMWKSKCAAQTTES